MILVGTFDWAKTLDQGVFHCPGCATRQKYSRRCSRPFLTVYFIPVLPIGGRQEYVQCLGCKTCFEPQVLDGGVAVGTAAFDEDLVKVAALTMLEDQQTTEAEIARAMLALRCLGGRPVTRAQLGLACSLLRTQHLDVRGFLLTSKGRWSSEQSRQLMQLMFLVAGAEGAISTGRMRQLLSAATILGLSEEVFQESILQAEQLLLLGIEEQS